MRESQSLCVHTRERQGEGVVQKKWKWEAKVNLFSNTSGLEVDGEMTSGGGEGEKNVQ